MRKTVAILILFILLGSQAYALDTGLVDMRARAFEESKTLKPLLTKSKDMILLNSLWDACIITISQLDAYFSMVGIFNTINKEDATQEAVNYLISWLKEIKKANDVNIISLSAVTQAIEPNTVVYMEKLRGYFKDLNQQLDSELERLSALKNALKKTKSR